MAYHIEIFFALNQNLSNKIRWIQIVKLVTDERTWNSLHDNFLLILSKLNVTPVVPPVPPVLDGYSLSLLTTSEGTFAIYLAFSDFESANFIFAVNGLAKKPVT